MYCPDQLVIDLHDQARGISNPVQSLKLRIQADLVSEIVKKEKNMRYFDYEWDLEPNRILLDAEINIDKLGWRNGDYFKVVNINGRAQLIKVDPVVAFVNGHEINDEQ